MKQAERVKVRWPTADGAGPAAGHDDVASLLQRSKKRQFVTDVAQGDPV